MIASVFSALALALAIYCLIRDYSRDRINATGLVLYGVVGGVSIYTLLLHVLG